MLLDRHQKSVGCNVDPEMLSAAEPSLVLAAFSQMRSLNLNIRGSGKVKAATKVLTEEMTGFLAEKEGTVWKVSSGPDATQVLPGHNLHSFSASY